MPETITISLNGKPRELAGPTTVAELIAAENLAGKPCAAEVNKAVVPKRQHEQHTLSEGDAVELVTLVGGG